MKPVTVMMTVAAAACSAVLFAAPAVFAGNDPAAPQQAAPAVDATLGQPAPTGVPAITGGPDQLAGAAPLSILDDFNRADGPIGSNWTVRAGWCNVASNAAVCGGMGLATFNSAPGDGNTAEADVGPAGSGTQYTGLVLNYGAGSSNLFLKVQQNGGGGLFDTAACYTGNNSTSFGLGFFSLSSPFSTAHMRATRVGSDVTIEFTNIDGGAQSNQTYVCSGAPAPEGTGIGIAGYAGGAVLDNFASGGACESDNECDDGLFCTGVETCDNGTCVASGDPCGDDTPVCDEGNDTCVECLSDDNCTEGQFCDEGVCRFPCELIVTNKEIRSEKLTRARKVVLKVTSLDESFDVFGLIDPGVFTWNKVKFNQKKKRMKILVTVPAGLAPGAYPISVGDCSGEVAIQ